MAWCPVCKNEYRPGIKICADCGAELVDELSETPLVPLVFGEEELLNKVNEFLKVNGIRYGEIQFAPDRNLFRLDVPKEDLDRCVKATQVFMNEHMNRMQQKAQEEAIQNATPEQLEQMKKQAQASCSARGCQPKVYESSAKKAEENKASAWSLLLVGVVGIVLIILCLTGVIHLPNVFNGSYLFFGVMGALCLLFVVMGILSFKNAKAFEKNVDSENSLRESLISWAKENLNGSEIDHFIRMRDPSLEGESLFFPRNEVIKARINHQFMNLDQAFLEQLVDEVIFEIVYPDSEKDDAS